MQALLVALLLTAPAPPAAPAANPAALAGDWRAARFGMTPDEVLAAFPGEAVRIAPAVRLADGNVIEAGIDGHPFEGLALDVRFVFTAGRLTLISLRNPRTSPLDPAAFVRLREALVRQWGPPLEETRDEAFIDMRQVRWDRGTTRADLKYIPGVVALVLYPAPRPLPPAGVLPGAQ